MKLEVRAVRALPLLFVLLSSIALGADGETDPTAEAHKKIKSAQVIDILGPDLVGDSTNLYTGSTSFNVVDVSLPGNNGLAVAVGRKFEVDVGHWEAYQPNPGSIPMQRLFGDWDLDIP